MGSVATSSTNARISACRVHHMLILTSDYGSSLRSHFYDSHAASLKALDVSGSHGGYLDDRSVRLDLVRLSMGWR